LFLILCGFVTPDSRCFAILKHSYLRRFAMHAIKWIVVTMSFLSIRDRTRARSCPSSEEKTFEGSTSLKLACLKSVPAENWHTKTKNRKHHTTSTCSCLCSGPSPSWLVDLRTPITESCMQLRIQLRILV
jgi:hypothetical protein